MTLEWPSALVVRDVEFNFSNLWDILCDEYNHLLCLYKFQVINLEKHVKAN